jgi:phage/plasmid primase-like uncharacterized protein
MSKHHNPQSERALDSIGLLELKRMAHGRWREILIAAGIPADSLEGRKGRPCPRCGGRDRFAPMRDLGERGAVLCRHCHNGSTDPKCGDGIQSLRWWLSVDTVAALRWLASWLGVDHGNHARRVMRPIERSVAIPIDGSRASARFMVAADLMRRNMSSGALEHCAGLLGLPSDALLRLGVGWSPTHQATAWPMRDADGNVIGIRLRCPFTARKWALVGSRAGLFFDAEAMRERAAGGRLWIVEGPTDSAALLSVGLEVVGAPSAGASAELLVPLARRVRPEEIVILADRDEAGQRGAVGLRDALVIVAPLRIVTPPNGIKDARAWVCSGAGRIVIEAAADAAQLLRIRLSHGVES